ncbi:acyl-CoA carboxylase subunit epsilon [Streptomyces somaliensis DSM 40738]|uniref:acyl-CoA carboxylase epsilon subunit n=1 Tax=Streptomyces somaliensis TaxID=78355 RepID=UPI0021C3CBD5|nr:acyl-CoA carboxylase epsilon subunit [Streptomyces somaliensis]MCQ0023964.1 acyl-CoA carboxylase subunit epsilon [Streptomyces somaliensis DSM 40738]
MIKVVRGNPTPEELAAALAVVRARAAAAAAGSGAAPPRAADAWSAPARIARGLPPSPGPRSWTRSYWPA